ncbi:putative protein BRICK1-B [Trachymyrmex cornetzi]|uniref:Protein BRICK1-B n=1 Tax=Trachymyrmex cornetzi TaxID=471704 RepID=A0A195DCI8_9HYME|nr:putative protein BRICK1-B [Trachymyrmex cornetzi]
MAAIHREAIQKQIQQDWANREYIEVITGSIKKITDFLNSFDMSCRSRIAVLNEKLTTLERRIEYLEACVSNLFFIYLHFNYIVNIDNNLFLVLFTYNVSLPLWYCCIIHFYYLFYITYISSLIIAFVS